MCELNKLYQVVTNWFKVKGAANDEKLTIFGINNNTKGAASTVQLFICVKMFNT